MGSVKKIKCGIKEEVLVNKYTVQRRKKLTQRSLRPSKSHCEVKRIKWDKKKKRKRSNENEEEEGIEDEEKATKNQKRQKKDEKEKNEDT
ncbi:9816_t:CDS:2, partial [Gigaspora rosea]